MSSTQTEKRIRAGKNRSESASAVEGGGREQVDQAELSQHLAEIAGKSRRLVTDFLARHFESLIVRPFKLDTHPELLPMMFGNYKRLIYLAQTDSEDLQQRAKAAAAFLGLDYEERRTGYGELQPSLVQFVNVTTHA